MLLYLKGVDQNSFFQELPFLATKNFALAKLSPCPQKNICGAPSSNMREYLDIYTKKWMSILHVHLFVDKATGLQCYVDLSPHFGKTLAKLSPNSVP